MRLELTTALFLAAFLLPFACAWWRARRWGLPVRVDIVEEASRPDDVAGYLAQIAQRLDERPERMRIVFHVALPKTRTVTLDLAADRALRVTVAGAPPKRVDLRGRWIADHAVPLDLRRAVLYVKPVDANRFRVSTHLPFAVSPFLYLACSLVATIGFALLIPEVIAPAAGLAFGSAWVNYRDDGSCP